MERVVHRTGSSLHRATAASMRNWMVAAALAAAFVTVIGTAWLLFPEWRRYQAVQAIVAAARHSDREAFLKAIEQFEKLGHSELNDDALFALLKHSDESVRCYGAISVVSLGLDRERAVKALIDLLETDQNQSVRNASAASLGGLGADASAAIPALTRELVNDPIYASSPQVPRSPALALLDIQYAGVQLPDPSLVPQSPGMTFWIPPMASGSSRDLANRLIAHAFLTTTAQPATRKPAPPKTVNAEPSDP